MGCAAHCPVSQFATTVEEAVASAVAFLESGSLLVAGMRRVDTKVVTVSRTMRGHGRPANDKAAMLQLREFVARKERSPMKQKAEAIIDENGQIHLMEPLHVTGPHRALVTVLDEPPVRWDETLVAAEKALAEDWLRPEEDEAWAHLQ